MATLSTEKDATGRCANGSHRHRRRKGGRTADGDEEGGEFSPDTSRREEDTDGDGGSGRRYSSSANPPICATVATTEKKGSSPPSPPSVITYAQLLRDNPNFRYCLLSYLINKMGEWMTYLASISLIQEATRTTSSSSFPSTTTITGGQEGEFVDGAGGGNAAAANTNTIVSILVLVKLLPPVLFLPVGGILADSYDRRLIQIILDVCSSSAVVVFWWSASRDSVFLCLVANFLVASFSGLYNPSNSAMLPQLFGVGSRNSAAAAAAADDKLDGIGSGSTCRGGEESDGGREEDDNEEAEECLKKANILQGMCWSLMAAVGSSMGGVLVSTSGIRGCFVIDSVTYLTSAAILRFGVQGNFFAIRPGDRKTIAATTTAITKNENENDGAGSKDDEEEHQICGHRFRSLSNTSEESLLPSRHRLYDSIPQQLDRDNTDPESDDASFQEGAQRSLGTQQEQNGKFYRDLREPKNHPNIDKNLNRTFEDGEIEGVSTSTSSASGFFFFLEGLKFLFVQNPLFAACALLKGSASLIYGATDLLNVSFSSRGSEADASKTSLKLGLLFGSVGVGCILGSMTTDVLSDISQPRRIARVCLGSFACVAVGLLWMASTPDVFASLCLSTILRTIGTSGIWINSTLLVQKFTPQHLLGRVSSFDTGMALLAEALSALGGGLLMDQKGLPPEDLSLLLAGIALFFLLFWSPLAFRLPRRL